MSSAGYESGSDNAEAHSIVYDPQIEARREHRSNILQNTAVIGTVLALGGVVGFMVYEDTSDGGYTPCGSPTAAEKQVVQKAEQEPLPPAFRNLETLIHKRSGDHLPSDPTMLHSKDWQRLVAAERSIPGLTWVKKDTVKRYTSRIDSATSIRQAEGIMSQFGKQEMGITIRGVEPSDTADYLNTQVYVYPIANSKDNVVVGNFAANATRLVKSLSMLPKQYYNDGAPNQTIVMGRSLQSWDAIAGKWSGDAGVDQGEKLLLDMGGTSMVPDIPVHEAAHKNDTCATAVDERYSDLNPEGFTYSGDYSATGPAPKAVAKDVIGAYAGVSINEDKAATLTNVAYDLRWQEPGKPVIAAKKRLWLERLAGRSPQLARWLILMARAGDEARA